MKRTTFPLMLAGLFLVGFNTPASAESHPGTPEIQEIPEIQMDQTQQTLQIAESFLTAAGSGDMDTLSELMADDFVWHNDD